MQVMVIPIVIGALGTIPKILVQGLENLEIRGQVETILTKALSRSAGILRRVLETWADLLPLKLQWETISSCFCSVDASIRRFKDYIEKHERGLITAIRNYTDNTIDDGMTITRKQKWEKKQLYSHFKRLLNNISYKKTWTWLRKGNLKKETESLLIAAQNNAIRTNHIKARIDKTQ